MKESVKQLYKALVGIERKVDLAENMGGEVVTLTIEEADSLIRIMDTVISDELGINPELLEVVK
jgi:hypothetical protein